MFFFSNTRINLTPFYLILKGRFLQFFFSFLITGNSRKGFWKFRLSCQRAQGQIESVYSVNNSGDDSFRTLFVNSPEIYCCFNFIRKSFEPESKAFMKSNFGKKKITNDFGLIFKKTSSFLSATETHIINSTKKLS